MYAHRTPRRDKMPRTRNPRYTSSFMAAKVMIAKNNRNVDSHSFEFLTRDEQPTLDLTALRLHSTFDSIDPVAKHATPRSAPMTCSTALQKSQSTQAAVLKDPGF